jgi:hypothetical protein
MLTTAAPKCFMHDMFDDPNDGNETPAERSHDPLQRAKEKCDEFRMHAELAAVFEGPRKFEAEVRGDLDATLAREVQRTIGALEKSRSPEHPILSPERAAEAAGVLSLPSSRGLSTNDYHVNRRPGEVMALRWLAGTEVETFYERLQAHFDAALNQFREEERQQHAWKQDGATLQYLDALDKLEVKMTDRYLRPIIEQHKLFVLSTQSADEIDIVHLADYLMGVSPEQLVGMASAPPEDGATETDRAWFFKLFSLRGIVEDVERMCFFTYLQKSSEF